MLFSRLLKTVTCDFILCSRGGYGSFRWIEMVDWDALSANAPMVVGFSDITFILCALVNVGRACIHGPMLCTLAETSKAARDALWKAMSEDRFPCLKGQAIRDGLVEGTLIGGNLACLCHTIGTSLEPDWDGKILFIEDCNEPLYKIDRMLTHLRYVGVFNRIAGMAAGSFSSPDRISPADISDLFSDRLNGFAFPVIGSLQAGHSEQNLPLKMGARYRLVGNTGLLEPAF